jgi:uncharacterized membrane protein YgaE (UPF0421/DUF939 family)
MATVPGVTPRPLLRLRLRLWPILQTAGAAVAAWYLAKLLVSEPRPVFASIAAVVALGATYGQRPERAIELVGGVVLGIGLADLLVGAIGSGPVQIGVLVMLAMGAAVMLGGGPVLVTEAGISAALLVVLEPTGSALPASRLLEALAGGGVALAVSALAFPPNPAILVGRAAQTVFGGLGRSLEEVSAALAAGDLARSEAALRTSRELDGDLAALGQALAVGGETARLSPGRRSSRGDLDRYARAVSHVDLAVRNVRVLARHSARFLRSGGAAPAALHEGVGDLALAVWALAAELDGSTAGPGEVRALAARGASRATGSFEETRELPLAEIVAQVRSTAIDLVRAAEAAGTTGEETVDIPTEELLVPGLA